MCCSRHTKRKRERDGEREAANLSCVALPPLSPQITPIFPHPRCDWSGCQQQSALHPLCSPSSLSFPPALSLARSPCSSSVNEFSQTQAVKQHSLSLSLSRSLWFSLIISLSLSRSPSSPVSGADSQWSICTATQRTQDRRRTRDESSQHHSITTLQNINSDTVQINAEATDCRPPATTTVEIAAATDALPADLGSETKLIAADVSWVLKLSLSGWKRGKAFCSVRAPGGHDSAEQQRRKALIQSWEKATRFKLGVNITPTTSVSSHPPSSTGIGRRRRGRRRPGNSSCECTSRRRMSDWHARCRVQGVFLLSFCETNCVRSSFISVKTHNQTTTGPSDCHVDFWGQKGDEEEDVHQLLLPQNGRKTRIQKLEQKWQEERDSTLLRTTTDRRSVIEKA